MQDISAVRFIRYRRKSVVVKTNSLQKELATSESVGEVRECWRGQRVLARLENVGEVRECWQGQRVLARSERVGEVREGWRGQRGLARSENVGEATTCRQRHTMLVNSECSRVHTVMTMSESLEWSQIVGEIV